MKSLMLISLVFAFSINAFGQSLCGGIFGDTGVKPNAPKVVVISGTNREGSQSLKVANTMQAMLQDAGGNSVVLDLAKVPPSTYSSTNYFNTPKTFQKKFDSVINQADSIVIVVPEYYGSFPGVLKTFFDYVQTNLAGKSITLVGISAGKWGARSALDSFAGTLVHRGAQVTGSTRINIENVDSKMNETSVSDAGTLSRMQKASAEIVAEATLKIGSKVTVPTEKLQKIAALDTQSSLQLNSGLVIDGNLANVIVDAKSKNPSYLQFKGPTALKDQSKVHEGQDTSVHSAGFGTPVGPLKDGKELSKLTPETLQQLGLVQGQRATLTFKSGVVVEGIFMGSQVSSKGQLQILKWTDCKVVLKDQTLFDPSWGNFDMAVGETVIEVKL